MALFGLYKTKTERMLEDIKLAVQREPTTSPGEFGSQVKEKRRAGRRDLSLEFGSQRSPFYRNTDVVAVEPVYDLDEVIKFQDLESYFRVSVDRHVEMIMKNGYKLKGKDQEAVQYVRRRLEEIELISDRPFLDILRSLVRNTVVTSNGYWVFSRDASRSTGRRIKMWGKKLNPISAISVPDPASVKIKQTATGRPYAYVQEIEGHSKRRIWQHHDVIHVPVAIKDGFAFGTPYIIPCIEDIKALRKFEMLSEHVGHKFAFPFMHWKVGNDKFPAEVTVDPETGTPISEVIMARQRLDELSQEGYVVTTHRHEVVLLGHDGEIFDLAPYIKHYEARVLSGLRVSEVDLGRGDTSNRGTAQVMSQVLVDACTEIQQVIASFINMKFIRILMMEGGYNVNPDNQVFFTWPPIDAEAQRAQETHGLNMYVQGGITREELRLDYLDRDELTDAEEDGLFLEKHTKKEMEYTTEEAIKLAKATPAPAAAGGDGSSGKAANRSSAAAQPSNQHGKAATKKRVAKNDMEALTNRCTDAIIAEFDRTQTVGLGHDLRPKIHDYTSSIVSIVQKDFIEAWEEGFKKASGGEVDLPTHKSSNRDRMRRFLELFRQRDLQRFEKSLMISAGISQKDGQFENKTAASRIRPAFAVNSGLLDIKLDRGIKGIKVLGYLDALKLKGTEKVILSVADDQSQDLLLGDEQEVLCAVTNPVLLDASIKVVQ